MENVIIHNIKYLIWKENNEIRSRKISTKDVLAKIVDIPQSEAMAVLQGRKQLSTAQQDLLLKYFHVDEETFILGSLLELDNVCIVKENISFLINQLEHGKKSELGDFVGANHSTVWRWCSGESVPTGKKLEALVLFLNNYFFLDKDIRTYPFFLDDNISGIYSKKQQLSQMIFELPDEEFKSLYSSLKKLLS
ncbi:hypothetical protein YDYSG_27500 [Paenibacillus tyrfis]|uniref:hypothetical protein n=1 Tax=Paenibacillus tyrfis TaxID=1501230 RepID=UPI002493ADC9|nr:hypothetical protein [Paenibacillus tyrfis]GLI06720.1 hypothetical protein YDYSG_27500 [Paenibacillus tyrfis]